jgi:hypothetical protein
MKRITFLFRFNILDIYTIKKKYRNEIIKELQELSVSEARVILLYSTKEEAQEIMAAAESLKMTGKNYMWIVTQSVLGGGADYAPGEFPPGMLGMNFFINFIPSNTLTLSIQDLKEFELIFTTNQLFLYPLII